MEKIQRQECGCGHDHVHHSEEKTSCGHECTHHHETNDTSKGNKQIYVLENLGCANCAAKMEKKILELHGVEAATITFATKQLSVSGDYKGDMQGALQKICAAIESDVVVKLKNGKAVKKNIAKNVVQENKKNIAMVCLGAILFAIGLYLKGSDRLIADSIFVVSYIILGGGIVWKALKNIAKGRIFDENFLMSLATIAAFVIGDFAEAVAVMLFYRVGELFEEIAVERSRNQIMEAVDMRPEVVSLIQGEALTVIPAQDAKVGDVVLVRPGDRIPLDGVILEGESRIDTSPVTGEPVPVRVGIGQAVISGCVNTSGVLSIKVEKELKDSMVSRILESVENAAANKPKLDKFITRFAQVYTPIVVFLAFGTAIIPSIITGDWNHWIYTAITFLVISCPCALVLSVPLAFFSGIGAGSKKGILFKGGVAIEALRDIKSVVMDKTGTITKGNFTVQHCVPVGEKTMEQLISLAASCEQHSTHPIGNSIILAANERQVEVKAPERVEEISGKGIRAMVDNQEILCGNRALLEMFHVELSSYQNDRYGTEVLIAVDGVYAGHIVIADTIKNDAVNAIGLLKKQNLVTIMLTGDAKKSAEAVAKEAKIDEVHAQLLPEEKLKELQKIRNKYGTVMFVGDGINDAPVLAGANVGAAMGSGADAAIEAADVVFMTSAMNAIPESIAIARKTGTIAMQNVVFALTIKAIVMVLGFAGFANMWMAVFADTGVAMLCVLNAVRILYAKQ